LFIAAIIFLTRHAWLQAKRMSLMCKWLKRREVMLLRAFLSATLNVPNSINNTAPFFGFTANYHGCYVCGAY